jgi:hypothetical protein
MSDQPPVPTEPTEHSDPQWEARLQETARAFPYPPTPDIAGAVRRRLEPRPPQLAARRRILLTAAVIILVTLCGLLAVPEVRAAILEVIRIGVITIFQGQPGPTPRGTSQPTPTVRSLMDLAGATTLSEAQRRIEFPLRVPAYPPDLGAPDHVFLQNYGGPYVVLVWMDNNQPEKVRLSLHQLGPGTFAMKGVVGNIVETTVNGERALWTEGPYLLQFVVNGRVEERAERLVTGHVLIWTDGRITYRLETNLSLNESRRVAESLR